MLKARRCRRLRVGITALGAAAAFTGCASPGHQIETRVAGICDDQRIDASAPRELRKLDFLIGDWKLEREERPVGFHWAEGPPAYVKGRYALGGHAILVEWYELMWNQSDPRAAEVRKLWVIMDQEGHLTLSAQSPQFATVGHFRLKEEKEGELVFESQSRDSNQERMRFSHPRENSWEALFESSADDRGLFDGFTSRFRAVKACGG